MKRWKTVSAVVISGALIATNLYLIIKEDSKVSRSVFVKEWTKVEDSTVIETYDTEGITTSAEEFKVYFNGDNQVFERFLVKEGDEVATGTPLYEYKVKNIEQQSRDIEREIAVLDGEIAGIDEYIQKLEDYKIQVPDETSTSPYTSSNMSTLDQEIYKQELERNKLEEEKIKLDTQLMALSEQSGPLTMDSEVTGIVKAMDDTLGNPVMTIASSQQAIEGVLSESEYRKTEVGMKVKIKSPHLENTMNGTIVHVENYPTKEPSLDKESLFPFQVIMESDETEKKTKQLVIGSKVDVTVITNKVSDAPTVPAKIIHDKNKPYVYKLTDKGFVNKEYISAGVQNDKKVEIAEGPVKGENVLVSPKDIPKNHSQFITPIQTEKVDRTANDTLTTREKWRFFLIGMLEK